MNVAASSQLESSRGKAAFALEPPLQHKRIHIQRECRQRFQQRTLAAECLFHMVTKVESSATFLVQVNVRFAESISRQSDANATQILGLFHFKKKECMWSYQQTGRR